MSLKIPVPEMEPEMPKRRFERLGDRFIEWLQKPVVAAVVLSAMVAYALGGLSAVVWVVIGAAVVALVPRIRQRLVKWYLTR